MVDDASKKSQETVVDGRHHEGDNDNEEPVDLASESFSVIDPVP